MNIVKFILPLFAALTISSCGQKQDDQPAESVSAPVLSSITPSEGATDVATDKLAVVFTYDQNLKCVSNALELVKVSPEAEITTVVAYNTTFTVNLGSLEGSTKYTVTVPEGVVTGFKKNQAYAKAASVSFTTKAAAVVVPDVDPDKLPERGNNAAWQMAQAMGLGWNLGNQMDAYVNDKANETCWGNKACTQQTFTKIKSYGIKTVRIPITWMGHIGAAPDYTIEKAWMDRVAEIVGYCKNAGLKCIINTHHDEHNKDSEAHWLDVQAAASNSAKNEQIIAEIKAVWGQIAERFKNEGDWLIFEPYNEIQDGGWGWSTEFQKNPQPQYDALNSWAQAFVDVVRASGGNNASRWLGIPGYAANPTFTMRGLVLPKDTVEGRLMVGVHCYDPSSFCGAGTSGAYEQWGHSGAAGQKPAEDERNLRKLFAQLYDAYVSKGIPCYIGECGCVNKTSAVGKMFQKYYLEYFSKAAYCYGMPCILWDNGVGQTSSGEAFGYINHGTGDFIAIGEEVITVMAKGQNDRTSAYTLDYVYNNAPRQ